MAVDIQSTDSAILNQAYEVQTVTFGQTGVVTEKIDFVIDNWNKGDITFKMVIVDPVTLKITYNVRSTLSVTENNRDGAAFKQMLLNFAPYADYNPTVTA